MRRAATLLAEGLSMRRSVVLAVLFASSVAISTIGACGGSTASSSTEGSASESVGASGGSVSTATGASLLFPPGALANDTTITIAATASAPVPAHATAVGEPYVFGPEGSQFDKPVTLTLPFTAASIPAGKTSSDIAIYTAPVGSTAFTRLATTLADATHASATTMHFSVFVPVVLDDGVDAGTASCTADSECARGESCVTGTCTVAAIVDAGADVIASEGCSNDSECASGDVCIDGACTPESTVVLDASDDVTTTVDAGRADAEAFDAGSLDASDAADSADAIACATGQTNCAGVCTDLSSDPDNCGECRSVCTTGDACVSGACSP
jgi:Stigma-specific protein, Stig1/ZU5 domain